MTPLSFRYRLFLQADSICVKFLLSRYFKHFCIDCQYSCMTESTGLFILMISFRFLSRMALSWSSAGSCSRTYAEGTTLTVTDESYNGTLAAGQLTSAGVQIKKCRVLKWTRKPVTKNKRSPDMEPRFLIAKICLLITALLHKACWYQPLWSDQVYFRYFLQIP